MFGCRGISTRSAFIIEVSKSTLYGIIIIAHPYSLAMYNYTANWVTFLD